MEIPLSSPEKRPSDSIININKRPTLMSEDNPIVESDPVAKSNGNGNKAVAKPVDDKPENKAIEPIESIEPREIIKPIFSFMRDPVSDGSPYTLESANLIVEFDRIFNLAKAEIESIKASINSIHSTAQSEVDAITNRAAAEISARNLRIQDLLKTMELIQRGISGKETTPPSITQHTENTGAGDNAFTDGEGESEVNES